MRGRHEHTLGEFTEMKNFILALVLIILSGCTTIKYVPEYVEVEIPIAVEAPKAPAKEEVKLIELTYGDKGNYDKITKSTLINQTILENKVETLETILDGYR